MLDSAAFDAASVAAASLVPASVAGTAAFHSIDVGPTNNLIHRSHLDY